MGVIGPLAVAALADWAGYGALFAATAVVGVAGLAGMWWARPANRTHIAAHATQRRLKLIFLSFFWPSHDIIVDVHDPTAPVLLGSLTLAGEPQKLAVRDGLVYIANRIGVELVDVRNPASPTSLGTTQVGDTEGVYLADGLAYITGYRVGMQIFALNGRYAPSSERVSGAASLTSADGTLRLDLAANALPSGDTLFQTERLVPSNASAEQRAVVRSFLVEARDTNGVARERPTLPYTVAISYNQAGLSRLSAPRIGIAYWNGERWVDLPSCGDCGTGYIAAHLDRFAEVALVADAPLTEQVTATPTATPTASPTPTATPATPTATSPTATATLTATPTRATATVPSSTQARQQIFLPLVDIGR